MEKWKSQLNTRGKVLCKRWCEGGVKKWGKAEFYTRSGSGGEIYTKFCRGNTRSFTDGFARDFHILSKKCIQ